MRLQGSLVGCRVWGYNVVKKSSAPSSGLRLDPFQYATRRVRSWYCTSSGAFDIFDASGDSGSGSTGAEKNDQSLAPDLEEEM